MLLQQAALKAICKISKQHWAVTHPVRIDAWKMGAWIPVWERLLEVEDNQVSAVSQDPIRLGSDPEEV